MNLLSLRQLGESSKSQPFLRQSGELILDIAAGAEGAPLRENQMPTLLLPYLTVSTPISPCENCPDYFPFGVPCEPLANTLIHQSSHWYVKARYSTAAEIQTVCYGKGETHLL